MGLKFKNSLFCNIIAAICLTVYLKRANSQNIRQLIDQPIAGLCSTDVLTNSDVLLFNQAGNQIPKSQVAGDQNFSIKFLANLQSNSATSSWQRILALKDGNGNMIYELLIQNDLSNVKMRLNQVDSNSLDVSNLNLNGKNSMFDLSFQQSAIVLNIYDSSFSNALTLNVNNPPTYDITIINLILLNISDGNSIYNMCGSIQNVVFVAGTQNSNDSYDLKDLVKYQGQARLLLHYDFQLYSGNIVTDLSGYRNNGMLSEFSTPQVQLSSRGILSFQGYSQLQVSPFKFANSQYPSSFTISMQLRVNTYLNNMAFFQRLSKFNQQQLLTVQLLTTGSNNQFQIQVCLSNNSDCVKTSLTLLNLGQFHRLIMVFKQNPNLVTSSQQIDFYLDDNSFENLSFTSTVYQEDSSDQIIFSTTQGSFDLGFFSVSSGVYVNKVNQLVSNCAIVIGSEQPICFTCQGAYYRYEGNCLPSSSTTDLNNNQLQQNSIILSFVKLCDKKCQTCNPLQPSQCYTCSTDRINNPPRCQCPSHTFDLPETSYCPSFVANKRLNIGEIQVTQSSSLTYSQRVIFRYPLNCTPMIQLSIVNVQENYHASSQTQSVMMYADEPTSNSFLLNVLFQGKLQSLAIKYIASCDPNIQDGGQVIWNSSTSIPVSRNKYVFSITPQLSTQSIILFIQGYTKSMNSQQQPFNLISCQFNSSTNNIECQITNDYYSQLAIGWIGIGNNLQMPSTIYSTQINSNSNIYFDNMTGQKNLQQQLNLGAVKYIPNNLNWFGGINSFVYNGVISFGLSEQYNPVMQILSQNIQINSQTSVNQQGLVASAIFNSILCPNYCQICQPDDPYKCVQCNMPINQCTLDLSTCKGQDLQNNQQNQVYCSDIYGLCQSVTSGKCQICPLNYIMLSSGNCQQVQSTALGYSYKDYTQINFQNKNFLECDINCTSCIPSFQNPSQFICTVCRYGFYLLPNMLNCVACPMFDQNSQICSNNCKYTCLNCLLQDQLWVGNMQCTQFVDQSNNLNQLGVQYFQIVGNSLQINPQSPCSQGCAACNKDGTCIQCQSGYSLQSNGTCVKCGNNCLQCQQLYSGNQQVLICTQCMQGSSIDIQNSSQCLKCSLTCASCDTYSDLLGINLIEYTMNQFNQFFNILFDKSSFIQRCLSCIDINSIVSADGQNCVSKIQNCQFDAFGTQAMPMTYQQYFNLTLVSQATTSHLCYQCVQGYTLSSDQKSCVQGCSITNCQSCAQNQQGKVYCQICQNGMYYDNTQNLCTGSCLNNLFNCQLCNKKTGNSATTTSYNQCLQCSQGFYDYQNSQNCMNECALCNVYTKKCLMCKQGYYLNDSNICVNSQSGNIDYLNKVQPTLLTVNIPSISGCKSCPQFCQSCYEGNKYFSFTSYLTQFSTVLTDSQRIDYLKMFSASVICTQCMQGYILNQSLQICEPICGNSCNQCVSQQISPTVTYAKCLSCTNSNGYILTQDYLNFLNSQFYLTSTNQITVDVNFLINPSSNQQDCQLCPLTCQTCIYTGNQSSSMSQQIDFNIYQSQCLNCRQNVIVQSSSILSEYLIKKPIIMYNQAIQKCVIADSQMGFASQITKDYFVICGTQFDLNYVGSGTPQDPFIFENLIAQSQDLFLPFNTNQSDILMHQYILNEIGVINISINIYFNQNGVCKMNSMNLISNLYQNVNSLKNYNLQLNSYIIQNGKLKLQNGNAIFNLGQNMVIQGFNQVNILNIQFQNNGIKVMLNTKLDNTQQDLSLELQNVQFIQSNNINNTNSLIYLAQIPQNLNLINVIFQNKIQQLNDFIQIGQIYNGYIDSFFNINIQNLVISNCMLSQQASLISIPLATQFSIAVQNITISQSQFLSGATFMSQSSSISLESQIFQLPSLTQASFSQILLQNSILSDVQGLIGFFLIQQLNIQGVVIQNCTLNNTSVFQSSKMSLTNLNIFQNLLNMTYFINTITINVAQIQTLSSNSLAFNIQNINFQSNNITMPVTTNTNSYGILINIGLFTMIYSQTQVAVSGVLISKNLFLNPYLQEGSYILIQSFYNVNLSGVQVINNDNIPIIQIKNTMTTLINNIAIQNDILSQMSFSIMQIINPRQYLQINNITSINCNYVQSAIQLITNNENYFYNSANQISLQQITVLVSNLNISLSQLNLSRQFSQISLICVNAQSSQLQLTFSQIILQNNIYVNPNNQQSLSSNLGLMIQSLFSTVTINNSSFINNQYPTSQIGLIYSEVYSLIIQNSNFTNNNFNPSSKVNAFQTYGGIGYLIVVNSLLINNSYIQNTQAFQGGCFSVFPNNLATMQIQNSVIQGCYSEQSSGGFMYVNSIIQQSITIQAINTQFIQNYAYQDSAIFFILPVNNLQMQILSCTFSNNYAHNGKIILYQITNIQGNQQTKILLSQSQFTEDQNVMNQLSKRANSQINQQYNLFYLIYLSVFNITQCTFQIQNSQIIFINNAISHFIQNTTISMNQDLSSNSLFNYTKLQSIQYENMNVQRAQLSQQIYCSICLFQISNLQIISSQFSNIQCVNCVSGNVYIFSDSLTINNSLFQNNTSQNGGSLYLQQIGMQSMPVIQNCQFFSNKALKSGGSMYLNSVQNLVINNTLISSNQAFLGGGIYVDNYAFTLQYSQLYNNYAQVGGGIYGNNILPRFQSIKYQNIISNNQAQQYGKDYYAFPQKLKLINPSTYQINDTDSITVSSGNMAESFYLAFLDQDNVVIKQIYTVSPQITDPYLVSINITNSTSKEIKIDKITAQMQNGYGGLINFSESKLTVKQLNKNVSLTIYSSLMQQVKNITNYEYNLNVEFRPCILGEEQKPDQDGFQTCQTCRSGSFSLVAGESCRECPYFSDGSAAVCDGGSQVRLPPGYWRSDQSSYDIFYCESKPENCVGNRLGDFDQNKLDFYCDQGYIGALCEVCDTDGSVWGQRYGQKSNFICTLCSDTKSSTSSSILLSFLIIIIIAFTVSKTLKLITTSVYFDMLVECNAIVSSKGSYSLDFAAIYVKLFIHYFSLIVFLLQFNLDVQGDLQTASNYVANPLQGIIFSLDCQLSKRNQNMPLVYYKFSWMIIIPFILFILYISFCFILKVLRLHRIPMKFLTSIGLAFSFIFFHSPVVSSASGLTFCRKFGQNKYILSNLSMECYTSEHLYYISNLIVPTLVIVSVIIPLGVFALMNKNRKRLKKISVRFDYSLFSLGYTEKFYYWELLKLETRVIMILIMNIFYSNIAIKGILVLLINIIYSYVVSKINPYIRGQLNQAEIKVNNVIGFSLILGVLLNNDEYRAIRILSYIVLALVNSFIVLYLLSNIFITLNHYIKKFLFYLKENFPYLKSIIKVSYADHDKINRLWRRLSRYIVRYQFRRREDKNCSFYKGDKLDSKELSIFTQDKDQPTRFTLSQSLKKRALLIQSQIYQRLGNKDLALICKLKSDAITGIQQEDAKGFFVPTTIRQPKLYSNMPKSPQIQQKINESIRNSQKYIK
ncbi:transmembrane protein, putative (macronuclear) [Tetrahymena thermophila SB210]|uniref:Transmembrane protein, putative n=1 Tax=Tetrahymena thermophila (strain SB210) TaxID=312017 RepID=I7MK63_TETTS|nr:transmembrane protein, putative [Tetrahymena thermophila SB210]EAR97565.2 transmembrane protein, putative [Tetrahymena thermophila SB210]|eukprot:XP_001017810.2 transmembrane protein, putative [Tetrahymena thermophila SB210]